MVRHVIAFEIDELQRLDGNLLRAAAVISIWRVRGCPLRNVLVRVPAEVAQRRGRGDQKSWPPRARKTPLILGNEAAGAECLNHSVTVHTADGPGCPRA